MEKKLIVKFHRGICYEIPAKVIAKHRADYFVRNEHLDPKSQEYLDEFQYVLEDEFELFEWVQTQMTWADLKPHATEILDETPIDLDKEWKNGNSTISALNY